MLEQFEKKIDRWLLGMKSQFIEKKDALKAVSVEYRKGGTWIKPAA